MHSYHLFSAGSLLKTKLVPGVFLRPRASGRWFCFWWSYNGCKIGLLRVSGALVRPALTPARPGPPATRRLISRPWPLILPASTGHWQHHWAGIDSPPWRRSREPRRRVGQVRSPKPHYTARPCRPLPRMPNPSRGGRVQPHFRYVRRQTSQV